MPDPKQKPDAVSAFLVEKLANSLPAGACPDANRIAGFAEGRLLPEEQEEVESHLAHCGSCRSLVATEDGVLERATAPPVRPRSWRLLAAASLFLAAAAVLVFVLTRGTATSLSRGTAAGATTVVELRMEESLVAAARNLAAERPALFAGFEPLAREERMARGTRLERGAPVLVHPVEKTLETRPTFRWEPIAGAGYEVGLLTLLTADGKPLWSTQLERGSHDCFLAYPPDEPALAPGQHYLWRLSEPGPTPTLSPASRVFQVATAAERARFDDAVQVIDARLPPRLAPLLRSHFALRMGLLDEAETAARAHLASHPEDAIAWETLFRALTLVGSSEADRLEATLSRPPK